MHNHIRRGEGESEIDLYRYDNTSDMYARACFPLRDQHSCTHTHTLSLSLSLSLFLSFFLSLYQGNYNIIPTKKWIASTTELDTSEVENWTTTSYLTKI